MILKPDIRRLLANWWYTLLLAINIVIQCFYFLMCLFKFSILYAGRKPDAQIHITQQQIQSIDERDLPYSETMKRSRPRIRPFDCMHLPAIKVFERAATTTIGLVYAYYSERSGIRAA
jgi:hypothetical protein